MKGTERGREKKRRTQEILAHNEGNGTNPLKITMKS